MNYKENMIKNLNLLKFYRVKDWIKNLGIILIGILASENLNVNIQKGTIALLLSSFLLAYVFSLNNYFDWKLGRERNYISELKIKKRNKLALILLPLFLSLFLVLIFFIYEIRMVTAFLLFSVLYTFYSLPPRLKKSWKYSLFINAFCLGPLLLWIGYFSQTNNIHKTFFIFSFIYFSYLLTSEVIHQISHIKRDKIAKIESFPIVFGIKKGVKLAQLIQFIVIVFSIILMLLKQKLLLIPLAMIAFSLLRILKIRKINNYRIAYKLREKMCGTHEGVFYFSILLLNFFLKFTLTPFLF
jgi:4-hydroxybenzoate polyprenyltransferase